MGKTNTIITIGRQFGSGGHDIAEKLAADLGIRFYDKEMLTRAAKESGLCQELFETHDEKPTKSFLYSLVMDTYNMSGMSAPYSEMPLNHKVFLAQFDAIKKIADEGPCVLVGRCADYALRSYDNVLNLFIHADLEKRVKRVARIYNISENKAREQIQKEDKNRASYYNYFTDKRWGAISSYDFSLNSGVLGIDGTVKAIEQLIELKESLGKTEL